MWVGDMKVVKLARDALKAAGRWDIDFHLPSEGIRQFRKDALRRVDTLADVAIEKRDPTSNPEMMFQYIDIASVDVTTGSIVSPQELLGEEAPSRARKVVSAFDIIVSTCRPTRGAIAVVPVELHNQIASTAFTVIRPKPGINPYYLYFALRLPSTLEQFRKWSTGSSYPAILDDDVRKTLVPMVGQVEQDAIADEVMRAFRERSEAIRLANDRWNDTLARLAEQIAAQVQHQQPAESDFSLDMIERLRENLPALTFDVPQRKGRASGNDQPDLLAVA